MVTRIAAAIEKAKDEISLEAAQKKYFSYFSTCARVYGKYKEEVDAILVQDDYEDCIVSVN